MPITTKPSEALKLALNVIQMPEAPWRHYPSSRGCHTYTCNALDYLVEAEEITEEARVAALTALYLKSHMGEAYPDRDLAVARAKGAWWYLCSKEEGRDFAKMRIAAIQQTIAELEAKDE